MKVKDLILELKKLDQESEVKFMYDGFYLSVKKFINDGRIWFNKGGKNESKS